jgi:two-component system, response regulator, stage 0 sporulation protein F
MKNPVKILFIDDEIINLKLFEINLGNKYHVLTALDGLKGLEVLKEHPDVCMVVSDMKMPHMNGVEFVKSAQNDFPEIKYYILTGYEISPEIIDALDLGLIVKYFRKPFNMKQLIVELENTVI